MNNLRWHLEEAEEKVLEIGEGEAHRGIWNVSAGRVGRLYVEQRGIDVEVRIFPGEGDEAPLRIVDGMNGEWGVERAILGPEAGGKFQVEVRAIFPPGGRGSYALRSEVNEPRPEELAAAAADATFDAAERLRRAEDLAAATAPYQAALGAFTAAGDTLGRRDCLRGLGSIQERLGRLTEAEAAYRDLLNLSRETGDRAEEVHSLNRLGRVELAQGALDGAARYFDAALDLARALVRNPDGVDTKAQKDAEALVARTRHNQAAVAVLREDFITALEIFSEVRRDWQRLGDRREEALTLYNMSRALQAQGRYQDTVDTLKEALEIYQVVGSTQGVLRARLQLGNVYRLMGNLDEAEALFENALEQLGEISDPDARLLLSNNLGVTQAEAGRGDQAAASLEATLEEARRFNRRRYEAMAALNLASLRRQQGDAAASLRLLERARGLFALEGDRRHLAACTLLEGLALRQREELREALVKLEEAADAVEALRQDHEGWDFRMAFFATRQTYYAELTDLLLHLYREEGDPAFLERAFFTTERGRARSLLDAIAESRLPFRGDPALLERERQVAEDLAEANRKLELAGSLVTEELRWRQRRLLREQETVRAEIRRSNPQYAELHRYQPLPVEAMRTEVLDADTRLLVYSLGEDRSFLFTLGRDEPLEVHEIAGRQRIQTAVEEARTALKSRSEEHWPRHRRALQRLSDLVLGPLAASLDGRRLAVVADGPLQTLPFAALLEPEELQAEGERPRWMLEGRDVVHLPSASSLAALRQEMAQRTAAPYELLAFGDPVFNRDDPRLSQLDQGPGSAPASPGTSTPSSRVGSSPRGDLQRLVHTAAELDAIRELTSPDRSRFLTGFAADRQAFEAADLEDFRILHFATHGFLDPDQPELSGIALSLLDESGRRSNGFLRTHEISARSLKAELAVLSACQTGLGKEVLGEGLVGLPRGFLYAGVPRVVVSLWNVDDKSTSILMADFYKNLADGEPPSEALRQAQLAMLRSDDFAAPYFWAPFIFLGDWRGEGVLEGGYGPADGGSVILTDPGKGTSYDIEGKVGP